MCPICSNGTWRRAGGGTGLGLSLAQPLWAQLQTHSPPCSKLHLEGSEPSPAWAWEFPSLAVQLKCAATGKMEHLSAGGEGEAHPSAPLAGLRAPSITRPDCRQGLSS